MPRLACIVVTLLLAVAAGRPAQADEAGARHVVREGTSGPVAAPALPANGVYYRPGGIPKGPPVDPDWRVGVALQGWGALASGTAYDDGFEANIDSGIFDKVNHALGGYVEIGYRSWWMAVDSTFIGLDGDVAPQNGFFPTFQLDQTTIDFRFGYTFSCKPLGIDAWGCCLYPRRLQADAVVGLRYWNQKQTLDVTSGAAPATERISRESWWDPYIGARLRWPFSKRWGATLYADLGGFGIGSDITWQIQALLSYRITRQLRVEGGYRVLHVDRVAGTGTSREGIDATFHGPTLGLAFDF